MLSFMWWLKLTGLKGLDHETGPDGLKADNGVEAVFAGVRVSYQEHPEF